MLKTIPATFSNKKLEFNIPDSWVKLTQQQLRYVYYALLHFEGQSAKIYIFVRLMGLQILSQDEDGWLCRTRIASGDVITFTLPTWKIQHYLHIIDFVDEPSIIPVCLFKIGKFSAIDPLFHGVPFSVYLQVENLYQGYIVKKEDSFLSQIACHLYENADGSHPSSMTLKREELFSVFVWYSSLKFRFSREFPDFFERVDSSQEEVEAPDMISIMNSEIRALTGGDITKEEKVLEMDCWRSLTELNEKAREAKEFKQKYGNK